MRNAPIVAGVPTPYTMHVHPWPTRFHGPRYVRPVFGFPMISRPAQTFTPSYDIDRNMPQPTLSGLGATIGEKMLWETGSGIFKPGGYGGGVFDGDISGLGALSAPRAMRGIGMSSLGDDAADYPWGAVSEKTRATQTQTNTALVKAGLCPIAVDGKLGGATCGARNHLSVNSEKLFGHDVSFPNPSTCDGNEATFKIPKPKASGCGSSGGAAPITSSSPVFESGMSSTTKRALGFALGGVLAIGAVVMMRKKK